MLATIVGATARDCAFSRNITTATRMGNSSYEDRKHYNDPAAITAGSVLLAHLNTDTIRHPGYAGDG